MMDNEILLKNGDHVVALLDFETLKEKIVFELVNTDKNRSLLENIPSRPYLDLSIIYRFRIQGDSEAMVVTVTNDLANRMGLTEGQLFRLAEENTKCLLPPTIEPMRDTIRQLLAEEGRTEDIDLLLVKIPPEHEMYVISNEMKRKGAAGMLYEGGLHELAERLGTDLYILPSSVHEVLAVSADFGLPEELSQMVQEVNNEQLDLADRLSNNVYHYDKDLRKISLATDAPAIGTEPDNRKEKSSKQLTFLDVLEKYFLTPAKEGFTFEERLKEGYEMLDMIAEDLDSIGKKDLKIQEYLKQLAKDEGILGEEKKVKQNETLRKGR